MVLALASRLLPSVVEDRGVVDRADVVAPRGQRAPKVAPVLAVFVESDDPCESFSATQVTDRLPYECHRNTTRNYLEDLVALGDLDTNKVGPSPVYWRPCRE